MKILLCSQGLLRSGVTLSSVIKRSQLGVKVVRMASTIDAHDAPRDPNTLSNYDSFLTTHTTANFAIDFQQKCLKGNVILSLKPITNANTKELLLDTSHLDVQDVKVDGQTPAWDLLSRSEPYGNALKINIGGKAHDTQEVQVDVGHKTFSNGD